MMTESNIKSALSTTPMNAISKQKASRATAIQLEIMVDFMEKDKDLRIGHLSTHFSKFDRKRKWAELTEILNSSGPTKKSAEQWRKYWHDQKNYIRSKGVKNLNSTKGTSGDPSTREKLTKLEERVLNMTGWIVKAGDEVILEDLEGNGSLQLQNQTTENFKLQVIKSGHNYAVPESEIPSETTTSEMIPVSNKRDKKRCRDRRNSSSLETIVGNLTQLIEKQNSFLATIAEASVARVEEAKQQSLFMAEILGTLENFQNLKK